MGDDFGARRFVISVAHKLRTTEGGYQTLHSGTPSIYSTFSLLRTLLGTDGVIMITLIEANHPLYQPPGKASFSYDSVPATPRSSPFSSGHFITLERHQLILPANGLSSGYVCVKA
jgi:hypothetical protein